MFQYVLGFIIIMAAICGYLWLKLTYETTIYDYQKGILYHDGKLKTVLDAGIYRLSKRRDYVMRIDIRKTLLNVLGQEILSSDKASLKISACGYYEISDIKIALESSANYASDLHNEAQIALREVVSQYDLDAILSQQPDINLKLNEALTERCAKMGLIITQFGIKDIMLPANLKKAFAGIIEAQKEAQIGLEKARGEQAFLRSLANSSKLYEENPALLQARLIQSLASGGNSIVFNANEKLSK